MNKINRFFKILTNRVISKVDALKIIKNFKNDSNTSEITNLIYGNENINNRNMSKILFGYQLHKKFSIVSLFDIIDVYKIEGLTINIHFNPIIVGDRGAITAIYILSNLPSINIYVDNSFVLMPKEYQLAIIAHEVGYAQYRHMGALRNYVVNTKHAEMKFLEQEYEADSYALKLGYDIHGTLIYMRDNILKKMHVEDSQINLINKRIDRLEKIIRVG